MKRWLGLTLLLCSVSFLAAQDNAGFEAIRRGVAYLAENKAKDGVKVTPSGLQYRIITEGTGRKPASYDTVEVNYKGTLTTGVEFDNSYKRGKPAVFQVSGVIPGWTEALTMMAEGSKWEVVIPSDIAYGAKGAPPTIGPNEVLIFEMELLKVH
jgi:FKBP-type peptidyl-prolyl cis-trans isomerase FklB